jgi:hypothetical protein
VECKLTKLIKQLVHIIAIRTTGPMEVVAVVIWEVVVDIPMVVIKARDINQVIKVEEITRPRDVRTLMWAIVNTEINVPLPMAIKI